MAAVVLSGRVDTHGYGLPFGWHSGNVWHTFTEERARIPNVGAEQMPSRKKVGDDKANVIIYRRIRAVAGIGSACGPGESQAPDLRESARDAPRTRKYRRAARLGCNWAQWAPGVRQQ
jgi:hypothetical protein